MSLSRRNIISTLGLGVVDVSATEISPGADGFKAKIAPMLVTHFVNSHGPTNSKCGITLLGRKGDFSTELKLKRWEAILRTEKARRFRPRASRIVRKLQDVVALRARPADSIDEPALQPRL